jgi:hypothetical protein
MAWTYSDPTASDKDAVRFLVGDTDANDPLVTDEEIEFYIAEFPSSWYHAAAEVAESIAAKFSREVSHSGDGLSYSAEQLQANYAALAERLRKQARRRFRSGAGPYVGGISHREREMADADMDKIPSAFRSEMHDHPGTPDTLRGNSRSGRADV